MLHEAGAAQAFRHHLFRVAVARIFVGDDPHDKAAHRIVVTEVENIGRVYADDPGHVAAVRSNVILEGWGPALDHLPHSVNLAPVLGLALVVVGDQGPSNGPNTVRRLLELAEALLLRTAIQVVARLFTRYQPLPRAAPLNVAGVVETDT